MTWDDFKPYVSALSRHLLTGAAGALMTAGALDKNQSEQFVAVGSSVALWLGGVLWSQWQKHKQVKAVAVAAVTGVITK